MTTNSFTFMPRALAHFGDELIRNEIIALTELVKNAYDAFATECKVTFHFDPNTPDNYKPIKIVIKDNGIGMTKEEIVEYWLTVGTDNKQKRFEELAKSESNTLRLPLGEKGIGRLGVHKLGEKVTLRTKTAFTEAVKLTIDWKKLLFAKKLDDFNFTIKPYNGNFGRNQGVSLIIEEIRGDKFDWTRGKLRNIYRALTALNVHFTEDDCRLIDNPKAQRLFHFLRKNETITSDEFVVPITAWGNDTIFSGLKDFDEIKKAALYECDILMEGSTITDFEYNFNPWPSIAEQFPPRKVTYDELSDIERRLQRRCEDGEEEQSSSMFRNEKFTEVNLAKTKIGQVYVKLYVFEQTTSITQHLDARGDVKKYLHQNSGIRVYRDGVRVYDYGEKGNDWLGLTGVGSIGEKLRNEHVVGFVFIDRKTSTSLREKTNREGFIENEAYKLLISSLKWSIKYVFLQKRNRDKRHLSEYYAKAVEPVLTLLNETVEYIDKYVPEEDHKKKLTSFIYKIEKEYKQIIGTLYQSAGIGVLSFSIVHEIEKIIKEMNYFFQEEGSLDQAQILVRRLDETIKKFSFLIKTTDIKKTDPDTLFSHALRFLRLRIKNHSIKLDMPASHLTSKCKASLTHATNIILNIFDNSIYWLNNTKDSNKRIYFSVTDQLHSGFLSILIADNGPGFPDDPAYLIKPFVSTKPMAIGSGLGLYIADELMKGMGGTITFPSFQTVSDHINNDTDFSKGAIVSLNFKKV